LKPRVVAFHFNLFSLWGEIPCCDACDKVRILEILPSYGDNYPYVRQKITVLVINKGHCRQGGKGIGLFPER
jgi:hypothetical protein